MGIVFTPEEYDDIQESLEYIRDVGPFNIDQIVANGAGGWEAHTIRGDDLGEFCWHLDRLCKIFKVE